METTNKCDYEDDLLEELQGYKYREMFEKANNIVLGFSKHYSYRRCADSICRRSAFGWPASSHDDCH